MPSSHSIDFNEPIPVDPAWFAAAGGIEALADGGVRHKVADDGALIIPLKWRKAERQVLKRKKFIAPSAWAEKHRYISKRFRYGGRWRNETVPYAAGIMDASFFKSVEEIGICAVPQSAKTELVYTCVNYVTDQRPGDTMILFPNELDSKDNAKDRIKPSYEDSPRMRQYLTGYSDDLGTHKLTLKNMIIYMAWANSPGRLSNRPCMYGYADEEDKHPPTVGKKEASPVDLLKKRSRTFEGLRKIWRTSSPSVEDGPIWRFLNQEAHVVYDYWVKCPQCGGWQLMRFEQIKWTEDVRDPKQIEENRDVWYECEKCQSKWDDHIKRQAVRLGQWRDRDTGLELFASLESRQPLRIGFHVPGWVSPFIRLYEIAAAFLKGQKGQPDWINKLKDFRNGFCAEPWEESGEQPEWEKIAARSEDYVPGTVPAGGLILTGSADVQHDRLEASVRAWGPGEESWLVRHEVIYGDPHTQQVWDELDKIVFAAYPHAGGQDMRISSFGIDASDGVTTMSVRGYCYRNRFSNVVFALKGASQPNKPVLGRPTYVDLTYDGRPIKGGVQLWPIGTDIAKSTIYHRLALDKHGAGYMHFYNALPRDYYEQLTAEKLVPHQNKNGFYSKIWVLPSGRRNEALDLEVYAYAAALRAGVGRMRPEDWDELAAAYAAPPEEINDGAAAGGLIQTRSSFLS